MTLKRTFSINLYSIIINLSIKSTPLKIIFANRKNRRKNVHGGNIFYPFCDMSENFTTLGEAHKISVQKQVRTAAQGLVLIFAKVATCPLNLQPTPILYHRWSSQT